LSGRGLCDELITRPEGSYRLCCVVVCDLETSRTGAPYIYDISHLRVNMAFKGVNLSWNLSWYFETRHNLFSCNVESIWQFLSRRTLVSFVLSPCKSNPITGLDRPWRFQEVEASRFQDNRHMNVVRLSALPTECLYHPGNICGTQFCSRLSRLQSHSAAGRVMLMKNFKDTVGNRTRDLTPCSAVP